MLYRSVFHRLRVPRFQKSAGPIGRYGVAVLVTGLVLLASLALRHVLEDAIPLVLFILAVMAGSGWG